MPSPAHQVNVRDARNHLSKLLARVRQGEEIVIAHAGEPIARLVPFVGRPRRRKPGFWKGKIHLEPDFDAPLPDDVLDAFER